MFKSRIFLILSTVCSNLTLHLKWHWSVSRKVKKTASAKQKAPEGNIATVSMWNRVKNLSTAEWLTNFKQWVLLHRLFVDKCDWQIPRSVPGGYCADITVCDHIFGEPQKSSWEAHDAFASSSECVKCRRIRLLTSSFQLGPKFIFLDG